MTAPCHATSAWPAVAGWQWHRHRLGVNQGERSTSDGGFTGQSEPAWMRRTTASEMGARTQWSCDGPADGPSGMQRAAEASSAGLARRAGGLQGPDSAGPGPRPETLHPDPSAANSQLQPFRLESKVGSAARNELLLAVLTMLGLPACFSAPLCPRSLWKSVTQVPNSIAWFTPNMS